MDEGMVPVSWLVSRALQQWEHEVKTGRTEEDKDGVRFTTIIIIKHDRRSRRGREAALTGESCS